MQKVPKSDLREIVRYLGDVRQDQRSHTHEGETADKTNAHLMLAIRMRVSEALDCIEDGNQTLNPDQLLILVRLGTKFYQRKNAARIDQSNYNLDTDSDDNLYGPELPLSTASSSRDV